jgi:acyl-CoA thioester hydrolase
MIHHIRVIFGDTDQMGVVYYANYLRYFESARAEYWRHLGHSYKDLDAAGLALPVIEAQCSYKRPAHYEDLLDIEIAITELRAVSMRFAYAVRRGSDLLAVGFTRHAFVSTADGRPRQMPAMLRQAMPVTTLNVSPSS